jgi:hypothetical protein
MVGSFFKYSSLVLIGAALGAHLPNMSSEVEFFDILYLGIFAILSPAFDGRFYHDGVKPPPALEAEIAYAVGHFHSLLNIFSLRFIILLEGDPVAVSYVVDRMLAEFAAATLVFSKAIDESSDGLCGNDEGKDVITTSALAAHLEGILQGSYPKVYHYYSRCLERRHLHFQWTGPNLQILPRSEALTIKGEMLDNPADPIYLIDLCYTPPPTPTAIGQAGKRPVEGGGEIFAEGQSKKRKLS